MNLEAVTWQKSSRSGGNGGECIELARLPQAVVIRDSKNPDGPKILLGRDAFATLVTALKH